MQWDTINMREWALKYSKISSSSIWSIGQRLISHSRSCNIQTHHTASILALLISIAELSRVTCIWFVCVKPYICTLVCLWAMKLWPCNSISTRGTLCVGRDPAKAQKLWCKDPFAVKSLDSEQEWAESVLYLHNESMSLIETSRCYCSTGIY